MPDMAWPYFRQRKAKVVPLHTNVIPINQKYAFNPSPLLPRRLLFTFECELYLELCRYLNASHPVELMIKLCLAYRPTARSDSTVALGWARLIAKDMRWRLYEGTYEYVLFDNYFVKLVDKGISVQAILLAWIRDLSRLTGSDWLWLTHDELESLTDTWSVDIPPCRLQNAAASSVKQNRYPNKSSIVVTLHDDNPFLDGLEKLRNLVVREQLRTIAPRVDEHMRQS